MDLNNLNVVTLLSDTSVADDVLVETKVACQALGVPGKPISTKTLGRAKNQPNGLEFASIAGRDFFRVGALRDLVRRRMRRPNPRREGRQNAGPS